MKKAEIAALEASAAENRFKIITKVDAKGVTIVTLKDADGNTFMGGSKASWDGGYGPALKTAVMRMLAWATRVA